MCKTETSEKQMNARVCNAGCSALVGGHSANLPHLTPIIAARPTSGRKSAPGHRLIPLPRQQRITSAGILFSPFNVDRPPNVGSATPGSYTLFYSFPGEQGTCCWPREFCHADTWAYSPLTVNPPSLALGISRAKWLPLPSTYVETSSMNSLSPVLTHSRL